ncbi:hypothetical protein L249_3056 [Ophiocordyceps polyrhachis-furcata BCC 54312]|uniref:Amidase domain-containing protein n=1 Tax=Ophiocordyceps polyrhachis-furcata BCC 54312 TaxID=1330021 RepID=A0A367LRR2_9HYPO|nr:hypothetical protein L249_3056 [Ophiocordyceps polyrhachis-furcata BCC 54312]
MRSQVVLLWLGLLLAKHGVLGLDRERFIVDTYSPPYRPSILLKMQMPLCYGLQLEEASIDLMQDWMENGLITSKQLVECYLRRIYQTQEYAGSMIEINPDALSIAQARDAERKRHLVRGPLHGIPFTVKDNIASKDKMQTTAGSLALMYSVVPADAHVLDRLRRRGAVLIGKAAMSEWADMRSTNYSEGYSARGGQCYSAYNMTVNPGGSSTGSAVGVSINAVAFSIGTETDGSILNPAMRNSVVGFKPTVGLTSRYGVIPESLNQDSVGTFGRNVKDAVLALDAIYGLDRHDPATKAMCNQTTVPSPYDRNGFQQFLTNRFALGNRTLAGRARFGIPWNSFWVHADPETRDVLLKVVSTLAKAGARIINNTEITNYQDIVSPTGWDWNYGSSRRWANRSEYTYVKVDFYRNIETYLSKLGNTSIRTLQDIVDYNNDNSHTEGGIPGTHPAFYSGQDGFNASLATGGIMNDTYHQALEFCRTSARGGIDDALRWKNRQLSALLVPLDPGQSYQIAAQAGYPMMTLPITVHSQSAMGIGLGLMHTAWHESELVKWSSAIEDLLIHENYVRARPLWRGHDQRKIPLPL